MKNERFQKSFSFTFRAIKYDSVDSYLWLKMAKINVTRCWLNFERNLDREEERLWVVVVVDDVVAVVTVVSLVIVVVALAGSFHVGITPEKKYEQGIECFIRNGRWTKGRWELSIYEVTKTIRYFGSFFVIFYY